MLTYLACVSLRDFFEIVDEECVAGDVDSVAALEVGAFGGFGAEFEHPAVGGWHSV